MKIGLVTIYQVPNYGSVLQAFATQCVLEQMGAECDIINYKYPNEWHWKHGSKRPNMLRSFVRKIFPSKKSKVLDDFRKRFLHLTKCFNSLDEMKAASWDAYDVFVVGSDQVWNARFVLGDSVYMLSFVPEDKPRYSLSSSFALKSLPPQHREKYRKELCKFEMISVRENNGACIIKNELMIDKSVSVTLDPTLLLSSVDWKKAIPRSSLKKHQPYILFYMWDYAFDPKPYIFQVTKYFKLKLNCNVIALEGYKEPEDAIGIVMENRCNSSIQEFIDLFFNADLVVTSSFHGTAFAINFGIPLVSIVPDDNGDDRQMTLLKSVGCEQCAVKKGTAVEEIIPYYDFTNVQEKLGSIRNDSMEYIKQIIDGKKTNK